MGNWIYGQDTSSHEQTHTRFGEPRPGVLGILKVGHWFLREESDYLLKTVNLLLRYCFLTWPSLCYWCKRSSSGSLSSSFLDLNRILSPKRKKWAKNILYEVCRVDTKSAYVTIIRHNQGSKAVAEILRGNRVTGVTSMYAKTTRPSTASVLRDQELRKLQWWVIRRVNWNDTGKRTIEGPPCGANDEGHWINGPRSGMACSPNMSDHALSEPAWAFLERREYPPAQVYTVFVRKRSVR